MGNIENNICEAIELIVNKAVNQASYDRTITATIKDVIDQTIGKYTVAYQDSTFYAYATSPDITYTKGAVVYVLVPGNDMSRDKTILGTTKKLGINYVVTTEGADAYEVIGNNVVMASGSYEMSSYRKNKYIKVLYSKDYTAQQNSLVLNKTSIEQYIKNSNTIICGAVFRTELPTEQQFRGNYGIIFALDFKDNTNNETVTRYFTVDVDKMSGNPYKLTYDTRQYGIFDIDGENFIRVNSISIFCYDFPNNKPDSECIADIFVKDVELSAAQRLSDDDINNYSLTFLTPQGIYYDSTSLDSDIRLIKAIVRIKGKVIDNNSQKLPYYWGVENVGITSQDKYYNKNLGQGWKCLNDYNVIKKAEANDPEVVEWIPSSYIWTVKKTDIVAKEVKFKCAVIYENTVITKTIVIKNLASGYDLKITSDQGTKFYFDIGFPTLTCTVNGKVNNNYTYSWAVTNNAGNFETLPETTKANQDYKNAYNSYHTLLNSINTEAVPYEPNKEELQRRGNELDKYNRIQRVEKNVLHHLKVSNIVNFSIYQCSVHQGNLYLGTTSITIVNSLTAEGSYSIVINDGSCIYKYNEDGISPASSALDDPIQIRALTFTVYDNLGNILDDEVVRHSDIRWIVPYEDTMLTVPTAYPVFQEDKIKKVRIYKDIMSFAYGIADRYDITKVNNNNIQLLLNYKGINLSAITTFTFVKEGEDGTNGTDFTCRIVPNVPSGQRPPAYPVITQLSTGGWSINYTPVNLNTFFRAQLWHNERKILDSVVSANSSEGKKAEIKWSILKNKYTSTIFDSTSLSVNETTGVFSWSGYKEDHPANIVKVTVKYDNVVYYATIPVHTVRLKNNNYRVVLRDYSGFQYVIYSSDGQDPRYDNTEPFELKVTQNISNFWEDVSLKNSANYAVTYTWNYLGRIYNTYTKAWQYPTILTNRAMDNIAKHQKPVKPPDSFDGQCVTAALQGIVYKNGQEIARIHIPVHLSLNRFGNSAINDWDGNSVNINKDGGFILAPQVGAGIKETDNSFTGVVIGKVKETNQASDDIGLIGYAKGIRSIFLDARTGKSIFGTAGKSQIVIDPTANRALLYSGNYSTANKTGMQIDLTTPEIRFGSGNFVVNQQGHLTAKGGGSLAGWIITDTKLYKGKVGISSKNDNDESIAFYAGSTTETNAPFRVNFGGHAYMTTATIGAGSNKIHLGKSSASNSYSALYSGNKTHFGANASGFYVGTDGIALGNHNGTNSAFQVTAAGEMTARSGYIGNGRNGWTIANTYIKNGKDRYDDANNGVYLGVNGIGLGAGKFYVTSAGSLFSNTGEIAGWKITANRLENTTQNIYIGTSGIKYKDNFRVDSSGNLYAKNGEFEGRIESDRGEIAGWTISDRALTAENIRIGSDGSIRHTGGMWYINSDGTASFNDVIIRSERRNSSMEIGIFKVDDDGITLGDFRIDTSNGWVFYSGGSFSNSPSGISASGGGGAGNYWLWAGYNSDSDMAFGATNEGNVITRDIKCLNIENMDFQFLQKGLLSSLISQIDVQINDIYTNIVPNILNPLVEKVAELEGKVAEVEGLQDQIDDLWDAIDSIEVGGGGPTGPFNIL